MNKRDIFDRLVSMFIDTDELGHYRVKTWSICLYNIPNKVEYLAGVRDRIDKLTTNYKFHVLSPKAQYTSVNILDIEL